MPLLCYVAFRRYLQAMNLVRPVMFALVAANLVNAAANWILIHGHFGVPAMGVRGSAYATLAARIFMAGWLLIVIIRHEAHVTPTAARDAARTRSVARPPAVRAGIPGRRPDGPRGRRLRRRHRARGPRVGSNALAAHQIALNLAALTFMVPLGVASAAAVRVGQAVGRRDPRGAASAGWTAIAIGVGFMSSAAIVFLVMPRALIRLFTDDAAVLEIGVSLLFVAAVFQLFDGLQGVTTGALRGLGDTRTAMLWNLAGHWVVGLPLGYLLCFRWGLGVVGLWWGLSVGLMICGVALLLVWIREGTRLAS